MGLFDFLKRKPDGEPDPVEDHEEPRCQHYTLAHYALRTFAHRHPLAFMGIIGSPKAREFFEDLMQSVAEHCKDQGAEADFTTNDLVVHCVRVRQFPCAVIEMPPPKGMAEAYFVAAVLLAEVGEQLTESSKVELRYFTLEKGASLEGPTRTVLCEWTTEGTHANYGDGPPAELQAFVGAIEMLVIGGTTLPEGVS